MVVSALLFRHTAPLELYRFGLNDYIIVVSVLSFDTFGLVDDLRVVTHSIASYM